MLPALYAGFMTDRPGSFSVLVVCDGNVCRSPAVQFAISRQLAGARLESAGMHASAGSHVCDVVRTALVGHAGAEGFVDSFRSRRISGVDVDEFDLVLAATLDLRGELARAHPVIRDRFFTMREAAHILGTLDGRGASDLVARMDSARGLVPIPPHSSDVLPIRHVAPFDIPDGHAMRSRKHAAVVSLAIAAGGDIGLALSRQLAPAGTAKQGGS
jgi:protein-tyrosine phosphatase